MQEMQFAVRFSKPAGAGFYRTAQRTPVSSLGIGSYLGEMDGETDRSYTEAVCAAVRGGINFIDTSLNHRHQWSELNIDHHFHFIQLPVNLALPEAFSLKNENSAAGLVAVLEAAEWCGITAVANSSLMQARLSRPGVTVALCGMSRTAHVTENLGIAAVPTPGRKEFLEMFQPGA
jgi:aryl-alcohol dehydrogenase-like predicted oxidoreductase